MKWKSTPALAVFAAAMLACGSEPDSITSTDSLPDLPPAPMRVLFVGNSLTWWNDLPDMVEQISVADPNARPLETVNTAGRLNWTIDSLRHELEGSRRDVVVLQENQYNESREDLITQVSTWANNVRAHGALPALYMVWPVRDSLEYFDDLIQSAESAAEAAVAQLYAAGEAWQAALRTDPNLPLYAPAGKHPAVMGSYLSALTIYRGLTGREPPSLTDLGISIEDDALLQAAAALAQPNSAH